MLFGQRKWTLKFIEECIWNQEQWLRSGEECRQWFIDRIAEIPVQRLEEFQLWKKNFREKEQECMEYMYRFRRFRAKLIS